MTLSENLWRFYYEKLKKVFIFKSILCAIGTALGVLVTIWGFNTSDHGCYFDIVKFGGDFYNYIYSATKSAAYQASYAVEALKYAVVGLGFFIVFISLFLWLHSLESYLRNKNIFEMIKAVHENQSEEIE